MISYRMMDNFSQKQATYANIGTTHRITTCYNNNAMNTNLVKEKVDKKGEWIVYASPSELDKISIMLASTIAT